MSHRCKTRFFCMSVILELSLIMGLGLYLVSHQSSQAYDSDITQIVEQPTDKSSILSQEPQPAQTTQNNSPNKIVKSSFPSNIGGPYTVAPSLQMGIYHAKKGDNLATIAKQNDLDFFTILSVNGLKESNDISIGQKLRIPNQRGVMHKISRGESIEDVALMYDVNIRKIIRVNQVLDPNDIKPGVELFIPDAKITTEYQKSLLVRSGVELERSGVDSNDRNRRNSSGSIASRISTRSRKSAVKAVNEITVASGVAIANPCDTMKMTSSFGYRRDPFTGRRAFHAGTDITPGYGSDVRAAMGGTVTYAGWMGGYGKLVVVTDKNGYSTRYGHLSRINVRKGSQVRQGQAIGAVGSTGRSTGAHLHFEVRKDGKPLNPQKVLNSKSFTESSEDTESITDQEELSPPTKDNEAQADKSPSKSKSSKSSTSSKKKSK